MGKLELVGLSTPLQQQPLALLAYLAIDGPKTRRHLGVVFWPDAKDSSNNLSSALTRIRRQIPDAFVAEKNTLASALPTDVEELEAAIERQDAEAVLRLYPGHFFETADIRAMGLELEEWVYSTRDYLAQATAAALLAIAERDAVERQTGAGRLAAEAYRIGGSFWVTPEPWQRCYELLASHGLAVAEKVAAEAREFGFELDVDVRPRRPLPPNGAANSRGELFGRERELAELVAFVDERTRNWLAIVGMGGVGKTALARALLVALEQRDDAAVTHLVSLADVKTIDALRDAIAAALEVPYAEPDDLVKGLERQCSRDQSMTLVLDNLEQLDGYEHVVDELAAIEGLNVIVTSRLSTRHPREQALRLDGLIATATSNAGPALFMAKARPFAPEIADRPEIAERVCELVDGLPLAIEFCAGWLRTLPLDVLVKSLAQSNELLQTSPSDGLESIDSLLTRSWTLLDPDDARVLSELALFDGAFSYVDATFVADTSLTTLARLIDSSLIERLNDNLVLHPLVRSHAQEQTADDDRPVLAAKHRLISHFRDLIVDAAVQMRGPEAGKVAPALAARFPNVQAAWAMALELQDWAAIADMVDGVDEHLRCQSRQFLAARLFEEALEAIAPHTEGEGRNALAQAAFVAIGCRYVIARRVQGRLEEAVSVLGQCLARCSESDWLGQMRLGFVQGHLAVFDGDYEQAAAHFERGRSFDDGTAAEWFVAEIDAGRALAALSLGHNDEGRALLRSVLDVGRRLANPVTITSAYYFLGTLEYAVDPAKALLLLEEGRLVSEQASMTHMSRKYATMIGRCHVKCGDIGRAVRVFEEALGDTHNESQAVREPWVRVANQSGMAMAHAANGDREAAIPWFSESLRSQVDLEDWPLLLENVLEICRLRTDRARTSAWADLLVVVATHPATMWEWKRDVRELFEEAEMPWPEAFSQEYAGGDRIDLIAEAAMALLQS